MEKDLLNILSSHPWADKLRWFDSIDSTNTQAKILAQAGAPHGTVLIADLQTGGRGRMGRSFSSPAGKGIYMSVVLRPECSAAELMHLTCAVAVAMCNAVENITAFRPQVKWINDLLADGKKLGGILTELALIPGTDKVDFAIIGVGINCLQSQEDFPADIRNIAISLKTATKRTVKREVLAAAMIRSLFDMDSILLSSKAALMEQYKRDCVTIGQNIYMIKGNEKLPCRGISLDPDGALIVEFPDGSRQIVNSGEVSVRPQ